MTAQAAFGRRLGRRALLLGAVGGELADIDVLFGPWTDPALPFELHRHFTHSLAFIPIGGAIAALPFMLLRSFRQQAGLVFAATTLAYATHGLLDNCTSYGTHLLWPFVEARTAWDAMSIVDPILTVVLLAGVVGALVTGRARPAIVTLAIALAYIAFGFVQHARAATVQTRLAEERGHVIERARVIPTLGNVVLWRSIYEHDGRLWADAVRVSPMGGSRVREGASRPRFTVDDLRPRSDDARARDVFSRLSEFATGFTTLIDGEEAEQTQVVGDARFSFSTAGFDPIWGIRFQSGAIEDIVWTGFPVGRAVALTDIWRDLWRPGPEFRTPPPRRRR